MKMLVADDDPVWRRMIEAMVREWGDEPVSCSDGREAWDALQSPARPSLAILDWLMPGLDGVDICRRLREEAASPYVYVLLLTAKDSKADLVKAFEAGADDYIKKPFDPEELRARLRAATRILDLQAALLKAQEDLRVLATRDSLTGLFNRRAVLDMLDRELSRAKRDDTPLGVLVVDVDHFKKVNDTYGHGAGDAVLHQVAERMLAAVRAYDAVGRYGGEELLIVLPECEEEDALRTAERTRLSIEASPCRAQEHEIPVRVSIGVASTRTLGVYDAKALIHAADGALYRAKGAGRNRCELARPDDLGVMST
jgi:two-component system, cell cycle response regulator